MSCLQQERFVKVKIHIYVREKWHHIGCFRYKMPTRTFASFVPIIGILKPSATVQVYRLTYFPKVSLNAVFSPP